MVAPSCRLLNSLHFIHILILANYWLMGIFVVPLTRLCAYHLYRICANDFILHTDCYPFWERAAIKTHLGTFCINRSKRCQGRI